MIFSRFMGVRMIQLHLQVVTWSSLLKYCYEGGQLFWSLCDILVKIGEKSRAKLCTCHRKFISLFTYINIQIIQFKLNFLLVVKCTITKCKDRLQWGYSQLFWRLLRTEKLWTSTLCCPNLDWTSTLQLNPLESQSGLSSGYLNIRLILVWSHLWHVPLIFKVISTNSNKLIVDFCAS